MRRCQENVLVPCAGLLWSPPVLRRGLEPRHRRGAWYGWAPVWVSPPRCDSKTCSQHFKLMGSFVLICAQKLGQAMGETQGRDKHHHVPVAAGKVPQLSELVGMLPCSLQ